MRISACHSLRNTTCQLVLASCALPLASATFRAVRRAVAVRGQSREKPKARLGEGGREAAASWPRRSPARPAPHPASTSWTAPGTSRECRRGALCRNRRRDAAGRSFRQGKTSENSAMISGKQHIAFASKALQSMPTSDGSSVKTKSRSTLDQRQDEAASASEKVAANRTKREDGAHRPSHSGRRRPQRRGRQSAAAAQPIMALRGRFVLAHLAVAGFQHLGLRKLRFSFGEYGFGRLPLLQRDRSANSSDCRGAAEPPWRRSDRQND